MDIRLSLKNMKGMISKFSTVLGDNGINITDMMNKSKGEYAYLNEFAYPLNTKNKPQIMKKLFFLLQ